jgi:hypothetical protein
MMAKRKLLKKSDLDATVSKSGATRMSAQELASSVAGVVNLSAVFATEFSATRANSGIPGPDKASIDMKVKIDGVEQADEDKMLTVSILFSLRMYDATDKEHRDQPRVEIKCKLIVMYHVPSFDGLSKENCLAFAHTSGVFSAWPYWREFVHSSSFRFGIDPIVLPTYHG